MKFNSSILVLVISVLAVCSGMPYLRKTNSKGQSKWEDFFIEDPNLRAKDFNLEEFWNEEKVRSSGWSDCGSSSIVQVNSIDLEPNPPEKGKSFTIKANVYLYEKVNSGAAKIYIVYNKVVPIVKTTMQVCELVGYFGESCPLSAGSHSVVYSQTFPTYALSGRYTGKVTASDSNGNELLCIKIDMTI